MDITHAKACLGIDLSSYQTKETALVRLTLHGSEANFEILSQHPFNDFDPRRDSIGEQIEKEIAFLNKAYQKNFEYIVIDAPIDLSQMPLAILNGDNSIVGVDVKTKKFHLKNHFEEPWALRMRPIDRALNGLAPVFSLFGMVTQRARLALAKAHASETYPKINRMLVGYTAVQSANFLSEFEHFLMCANVRFESKTDVITKDEFDAIWCALAGLDIQDVATNHRHALENPRYAKLTSNMGDISWPQKYRLLVGWPSVIDRVVVTRERR